MIIYIIQLILIIILGLILKPDKNRKNKKLFCILSFCILALVASFRSYTVGYDTEKFVKIFIRTGTLSFQDLSNLKFEWGFTFLCWFLNKITNNWQILLIITSLFINFSVIRFIYKNSKNPLLSVLLFVLLNFYLFYMSIMRQAIAIGIILLGYEKLKENKCFKYCLYIFIAFFFHNSALLALLLIPLKKIKYNKNFSLFLISFYIFAFIFAKDIYMFLANFSAKLLSYSNSIFFVENYFGSVLQFLVHFIMFIIGYILMIKNNKNILYDKKDNMNTILGILAISNLFILLTIKANIFNRFSPYFSIFLIIWFPNLINEIKNVKLKSIISVISFLILLSYWFIIGIFRPEWYGAIPYEFFI